MNRVMVVEDNVTNMKLALSALELSDFEACGVSNAREALGMLPAFKPNAILMDIQLPDVDGLSLTRQIKKDPRYKDIIIVAITAYAMKGDREKMLAAGCDEYVAKPADIFEVIDLIGEKITLRNNPA